MRIYKPKWRQGDGWYVCPRYYAQFHLGGKLFRFALGTADKRVAEEKAAALRKREERRRSGLFDAAEDEAARPLEEHLADFEAMLRSREVCHDHFVERMAALRAFATRCRASLLRDLDSTKATAWLSDLRAGGLSARSINKRLAALRQFARWGIASQRLTRDPFVSLRPLNEAADRRHVRRALSNEELSALLDAARTRPLAEKEKERLHKGVTPKQRVKLLALGRVRALAYAVAAGTGLRQGELKRLRWQDVDLDAKIVRVPAASAKSRRDQSVPLRSDLAASLAAHMPKGAAPSDAVFSGRQFPTLRTFKRDAVGAGLGTSELPKGKKHGCEKYDLLDKSGRSLDFHCLRVTFVSGLVAAGVHPRVAQALARHAKIETTMAIYTDVHALDLRGAVERLAPQAPAARRAVAGK